jgi:hypothetical protein
MPIYNPKPIVVRIKEQSLRARIGAWKLGTKRVAMVWGYQILLHNTSREEFLANKAWVRHELRHIWQVHQMGAVKFLWRYFVLALKFGYQNHPYERDARHHENDDLLEQRVVFK